MPHAASDATAGSAGSEYCSSRAGVAEKNAITAASQVHAKPLAAPASGTRRIHGMLRSRNVAQNSSSGSPTESPGSFLATKKRTCWLTM